MTFVLSNLPYRRHFRDTGHSDKFDYRLLRSHPANTNAVERPSSASYAKLVNSSAVSCVEMYTSLAMHSKARILFAHSLAMSQMLQFYLDSTN